MSDIMTTFFIIMSEAAGFFAVIIIIALVIKIRSGLLLKQSAKLFVKQIKNEDSEHGEKLKNIFINDYGLDKSSATSAIENLIKQEHLLYSKIIELYLGGKDIQLKDISNDVKNLTKGMHGVTIKSLNNSEKNPDLESNDLSAEVEKLKDELEKTKTEKEQIQKELKDAMDTMEGMMTEYASMYAGGVNEGDIKMREEMEKIKEKKSDFKEKTKPADNTEITVEDNASTETAEVDLNVDVPDLDIDESGTKK